MSHFLSNFCSHHHSAVMPWTVSLTFPEEEDDCKNQDSHKDARDEGQGHVQYFMAVDTQKILSEPPVSTEGLKHQQCSNSPNFMECNIYPQPHEINMCASALSISRNHPSSAGNYNQILTPQDVKYVIHNPSLAGGGCSLRELWV